MRLAGRAALNLALILTAGGEAENNCTVVHSGLHPTLPGNSESAAFKQRSAAAWRGTPEQGTSGPMRS